MTDKLDLRVPRRARFTRSFKQRYAELRALEKGPFRAAKYYEYAGDLREYGHSVRLNLYCQMDRKGNHKIELIDVGQMKRAQIVQEVREIFDVDPLALEVMRVDFAVDVPDLPLQWFRETVRVQYKRFRAAVTGQPFYSEIGKGDIQTLYFGKRPNLIRIYDKQAEYHKQYRTLVRKFGKDVEPPSFQSVFGLPNHAICTRIERQIGGRIPAEIKTLRNIVVSGVAFRPFAKLKIIDHPPSPGPDSNASFETRCTGLYLRSIAQNDGMQAANAFISKYSNGNASWVRRKYQPFLASPSSLVGMTDADLQQRFEESLIRQMSA